VISKNRDGDRRSYKTIKSYLVQKKKRA